MLLSLAQLSLKLAKLEGDLQGTKQLLDERSNELAIERSLRAKLESSSTASQAKKTLVLGSSIIRDLDETLYSNTEVIAQSGAKPTDLLSTLKDKEKKGEKYEKTIIAAGGNQLNYENSEGDANRAETVADMKKLINVAKSISDDVMLCELSPRLHTKNAARVISELNIDLEKLAQSENCQLVKTSQCFHLADGTANDGYLNSDKVHLNMPGSAKLVQCMDLKLKNINGKKANKKAAYKNSDKKSQKAKPPFSEMVQQDVRPPTQQLRSAATHPQKQKGQNATAPSSRLPPLHPENGYCGYCGEPGHHYKTCRHGKPVQCRKCGDMTHKQKFCHLYHYNPNHKY